MRLIAILAFTMGCTVGNAETVAIDAAATETESVYAGRARRGPRKVGCRELHMRLSVSMCRAGETVVPAEGAEPTELLVEFRRGLTIDECIREWERLAQGCPR